MPKKWSTNNGLVMCLQCEENGPIRLYKATDSVFYFEGIFVEENAMSYLGEYTRLVSLHYYRGDIFSGIYAHNNDSKDILKIIERLYSEKEKNGNERVCVTD